MATKGTKRTQVSKENDQGNGEPTCLKYAGNGGIKTSQDFTNFFSCLISDLAKKTVVPNVGNAMCNAGGKIIKMVELEIRYGQHVPGHGRKLLTVSVGTESIDESKSKAIAAGEKS